MPEPPAPSPAASPVAGAHPEGRTAPAKAAPSHALPPGVRLRHYELTGLVGAGGFGIVYTARDHRLERTVAIKEYMPAALAARRGALEVAPLAEGQRAAFEAGLKSFVNEARMLASFEHPNLVAVYDFWHENGTAYMVMPYCRGVSLRTVLQQLGAPPSEAWLKALLRPLLDALALLHARNCVHRDISPDNIQILPNGAPLLLDFGAAREVRQGSQQPLTVILRPGFAPVEQYAEGTTSPQGPWTDLYALAAVVHFAITGLPPKTAVARLVARDSTPLGDAATGRYDRRFLAGLDAALAVKPEDRPADVAQFAAAIGLDEPDIDADANAVTLFPGAPDPTGGSGNAVTVAAATPAPAPDPDRALAGTRAAAAAPAPAAEPLLRRAGLIGVGGALAFAVAVGLGWYAWRSPLPAPATAANPSTSPPAGPAVEAATAPRIDVPTPAPAAPAPAPAASGTVAAPAPDPATTTPPAEPVTFPAASTRAEPVPTPPATTARTEPMPTPPAPATKLPPVPVPAAGPARTEAPAVAPPATSRPDAGGGDRIDVSGRPAAATAAARRPTVTTPAREEKPAPGGHCSDVLMRLQMGEALSEQENAKFQKECKR